MINTNTFDVLVVYTGSVATSASSTQDGNNTPFSLASVRQQYSQAYAYFLTTCKKYGLKAAFTTSDDITGPATCKSYWEYKNTKWIKVLENGSAPLIFDKFSPLRHNLKEKRKLLFSKKSAKPFNDPYLMSLFNDKLKTHKELLALTIPTVGITYENVAQSILELQNLVQNHKHSNDFTKKIILKDRFGSSGVDIFQIYKNPIEEIQKIMKNRPNVTFIIQPFIKFKNGYSYNNSVGYADIRIIYLHKKVIQRYIRSAQEKNFRCNEHQGGKVSYVGSKAIPQGVSDNANKILNILDKKDSLFALDFLVSDNGNAYFLEGNINPGIYWGSSNEDKINTKKLIVVVVKELKRRTDEKSIIESLKNKKFNTSPILFPVLPLIIVKTPLVV